MKTFSYIVGEFGRNDHVWTNAGGISAEILRDLDEVDSPKSVFEVNLRTKQVTDVSERYADQMLFAIVEKESAYEVIYTDLPDFVQMNSNRIEEVLQEAQDDRDHFNKYGY